MALILHIETTTEVCSVALSKGDALVALKESGEGMNHSKLLAVFVDEILNEQNIKAKDLDAIAISGGPGSYTGLRIGTSVAKGLCYGANIPMIAVSPLQAMANHVATNNADYQLTQSDNRLYCAMIDARRMEVYAGIYDQQNEVKKEVSADIIDEDSYADFLKQEVVFFGNGADKCIGTIADENAVFIEGVKSSAQFMIPLALNAFEQKAFVDVAYYEPFYLKNFVATVPKKNILK
ncbi:tRNA (adenosine(37)-N6)-threonylcarbamoyltransferase complex dimerization subunit type 1 TsaB [Puteibacter caeruleilacunae]|nr:tRNA (adenosine(37)-N6)-threonylcarbamoyltransferase complex dimerization subunit type 1 TsaB [Puteibacter caeruleilacunae]